MASFMLEHRRVFASPANRAPKLERAARPRQGIVSNGLPPSSPPLVSWSCSGCKPVESGLAPTRLRHVPGEAVEGAWLYTSLPILYQELNLVLMLPLELRSSPILRNSDRAISSHKLSNSEMGRSRGFTARLSRLWLVGPWEGISGHPELIIGVFPLFLCLFESGAVFRVVR